MLPVHCGELLLAWRLRLVLVLCLAAPRSVSTSHRATPQATCPSTRSFETCASIRSGDHIEDVVPPTSGAVIGAACSMAESRATPVTCWTADTKAPNLRLHARQPRASTSVRALADAYCCANRPNLARTRDVLMSAGCGPMRRPTKTALVRAMHHPLAQAAGGRGMVERRSHLLRRPAAGADVRHNVFCRLRCVRKSLHRLGGRCELGNRGLLQRLEFSTLR